VLAAVVVAATSYGLGTLETRTGEHRIGDRHAVTSLDAVRSPGAGNHSPRADPSVSPSIAPQALAQARALRALLVHSAADKQAIAGAVAQLTSCRHLAAGVATFEDAAQSSDRLLERAAELPVGLLPGGGAAIASFSQALRAAAEADRAYVAWGQARHKVHHQCRGGQALRLQAVRLSSASHDPKQRTAAAWNLIATQLGLPTISWTIL
jgi:uncharacterized protein with beta-barrel porin domain